MTLCLTFALLPESAPSQDASPSPPAARPHDLVVQNLAPHARREWLAVAVPFASGAVPAGQTPDLHVDGHATTWQPFGARWPDGSLRQALACFSPSLGATAERRLALRRGAGPTLEGPEPALPGNLQVDFLLNQKGTISRAAALPAEVLEVQPARRVELWRCRFGDGLVGEVILTAWRGQPHLDADVAVFFSSPQTTAMDHPIDELGVETRGLALALRHGPRFGIRAAHTAEGSSTSLLRACRLGDGQGIRRAGVLVPKLDALAADVRLSVIAAVSCPLLGATAAWRDTGTWGAFGVVPAPPAAFSDLARVRQHLAQRHAAFARAGGNGDPFWSGQLAPARNPSQTGDQEDFGVAKLGLVAGTGLPSMLLELEPCVLQEACRPVHCFEADGAPVQSTNHPEWVVWSGRTHWHCEVSKDRLGKPCPEPRFERNGWGGKDREHWSTNYAAGMYLLTGAHWLRRELDNETELFLAGETIDPRFTTSGPGAARGVGRTLQAGCWLYVCTGNQALLQRMVDRLDKVILPSWAFRDSAPERVRPLAVCDKDPRMLDGQRAYWNPWQEAIAATGLAAAHRLTGAASARQLAAGIAKNVVRHGFRTDGEQAMIATAIAWRDGEPIAEAELLSGDKSVVVWSNGTAFSEWALPAVEMARIYALEDGDAELAARAALILTRLRRNGGMRTPDWDCVR